MNTPSILRRNEDAAFACLGIAGDVLDIGGDTRSAYRKYFAKDARVTTINLDPSAQPDISLDLEKTIAGNNLEQRFDEVLLVNVLEHIYRADGLLADACACVRPGGRVVVVVPFLFPVHPSPKDFRRFTDEALRRMFADAGCVDVAVTALGSGVFASTTLAFERLMPTPVRWVISTFIHPLVRIVDRCFSAFARMLGKAYVPSDYALGYIATARTSKN
jgi:SAM-dependent methyltransferase